MLQIRNSRWIFSLGLFNRRYIFLLGYTMKSTFKEPRVVFSVKIYIKTIYWIKFCIIFLYLSSNNPKSFWNRIFFNFLPTVLMVNINIWLHIINRQFQKENVRTFSRIKLFTLDGNHSLILLCDYKSNFYFNHDIIILLHIYKYVFSI